MSDLEIVLTIINWKHKIWELSYFDSPCIPTELSIRSRYSKTGTREVNLGWNWEKWTNYQDKLIFWNSSSGGSSCSLCSSRSIVIRLQMLILISSDQARAEEEKELARYFWQIKKFQAKYLRKILKQPCTMYWCQLGFQTCLISHLHGVFVTSFIFIGVYLCHFP